MSNEEKACPNCGGEMVWRACDTCGGEGLFGHECGEDCCMCDDPDEDNVPCDICDGGGGWMMCGNSKEWCEAHPIEGRPTKERA